MRKPINGFEGLYEVDENGDVYTTRRQGSPGGKIHPVISTGGYARVKLSSKEKRPTLLLHRIVAETFIPNPENHPCVNHKDGDKSNNSVGNLEWCDYSTNMKHAISHGLNRCPRLRGEKSPSSKLNWGAVKEIRNRHSEGDSLRKISLDFGISEKQVWNIVTGKHWKEGRDE